MKFGRQISLKNDNSKTAETIQQHKELFENDLM